MPKKQEPDGGLDKVRKGMKTSADPRVSRTRAAILAAVARGAGEGEVSVGAIAESAGVARSSFYTHFSGLDDLAVSLLEDVFAEIGTADLESRRSGRLTGTAAARAALVHLTTYLEAQRPLYAAVFGLPITSQAFGRAVDAYADHVVSSLALVPGGPVAADRRAVAEYTAGGTLTVLMSWLRSSDPQPLASTVELLLGLQPRWLVEDRSAPLATAGYPRPSDHLKKERS